MARLVQIALIVALVGLFAYGLAQRQGFLFQCWDHGGTYTEAAPGGEPICFDKDRRRIEW